MAIDVDMLSAVVEAGKRNELRQTLPEGSSSRRRTSQLPPPCGQRGSARHTCDLTGARIEVRRCQPQDAPAVLDLWAKAQSEHATTANRIDEIERLIADSPAALLIAEQADQIVGALIAAWDGWRGNMYRLAVREGWRRQGIAIALTRAGEEYLRACGARRVTALVAFEDEVAGCFWEFAGYTRDCEIGRRVRNL